jgi:hypothetical protein
LSTKPTDDANPSDTVHTRGWAFKLTAMGLAAVALTVVSGYAGLELAKWLSKTNTASEEDQQNRLTALTLPKNLCRDWPKTKPDLVLLLSAQQHGYLMPCGCSRPQVGGLERRYNLLRILEDKGWPVVAADVGDIPQMAGPAKLPNVQGIIKYKYSMMALKKMGYTAVGFGEYEAALDLFKVLGEYALNEPSPRVLAANLRGRDDKYAGMLKDWEPAREAMGGKLPFKVGITAALGPTVTELAITDKELKSQIGPSGDALKDVLKQMNKEKVELSILLYQGSPMRGMKGSPYPEAQSVARAFPQFPIILCKDDAEDPPSNPYLVKDEKGEVRTRVISLGHKGKHVGLVGVYRTGKADRPFDFRYQLVDMSEEFLTPEAEAAKHPIIDVMDQYTRELKQQNYLAKYGQSKHALQAMDSVGGIPGVPTYVGSEACKGCHKKAYEIWEKSGHGHAYQTLVDAKRPSNRQFDAECIVCHTTGFSYNGGFTDAARTPLLKNVGCESCHGPGSLHVANKDNEEWQARMNPWKAPEKEDTEQKKKRMARVDEFCQRCHDTENDVTWTRNGFERKWPLVEHSGKK